LEALSVYRKFQLFSGVGTKEVKKSAAEIQLSGKSASWCSMRIVSKGVRSTRNQDGTVVLDIERGRILRLNTTASSIFERLQQGQTESQIVDGICQEFRISSEIVQADVGEFLTSMEQAGLIYHDTPKVQA
jgi:hypothetical protein